MEKENQEKIVLNTDVLNTQEDPEEFFVDDEPCDEEIETTSITEQKIVLPIEEQTVAPTITVEESQSSVIKEEKIEQKQSVEEKTTTLTATNEEAQQSTIVKEENDQQPTIEKNENITTTNEEEKEDDGFTLEEDDEDCFFDDEDEECINNSSQQEEKSLTATAEVAKITTVALDVVKTQNANNILEQKELIEKKEETPTDTMQTNSSPITCDNKSNPIIQNGYFDESSVVGIKNDLRKPIEEKKQEVPTSINTTVNNPSSTNSNSNGNVYVNNKFVPQEVYQQINQEREIERKKKEYNKKIARYKLPLVMAILGLACSVLFIGIGFSITGFVLCCVKFKTGEEFKDPQLAFKLSLSGLILNFLILISPLLIFIV